MNSWLSRTFSRGHIGGVMIASGGICFVISLVSLVYSWHFVRVAAHTDGKIIRMIEHTDKDGDTAYFPVFSFRDGQGNEQTIHSSSGSFPPDYEVGDTVPVLYRPDDPSNAKINSFSSIWGISLITGIIALVDLPAGIVVLFWPNIAQRFKRKPEAVTC